MLQISATIQQTANPNQWQLNDTTPLYSLGNLGGWGYPNDAISSVKSVYLNNCVFYNAPANGLVQNLGNIELMPSPNALPYVYLQSYTLTPSLLGLPSFNNGLLTCVYTIQTNILTIADISISFPSVFAVGDVITDVTSGKVLGVATIVSVGTLVLSGTGNIYTPGDELENQLGSIIGTNNSATGIFTTNTYTYDIQFGNLSLVEWNMGNKLACIDLKECGCNCDKVEALFDNVMIPIIVANAQCGAAQNKAALNSIFVAQSNSVNLLA